ncbi:MAG: phosphoribosylaminoimidazolesuccinocarboxamide synthase, partial [Pseudomonadota bacterium]
MNLSKELLERGLEVMLAETAFSGIGQLQKGKVRDSYQKENRRTIVVTDRVSAFDVVLGTVPFKGQVLNGLSNFWFEETGHLVPNHLLETPDPVVTVVEQCQVIPVEMVVRAYLTGSSPTSIWTHYNKGERVYCGHRLREGLKKHEALEKSIITPTTKASHGDHDTPISAQEIVNQEICTAEEFDQMSELCLKLFDFGSKVALKRGLVLVDTKYELGRRTDGTLVFVDEIHTPDSSRYWYSDSYEQSLREGKDPRALDKEF